MNKAKIAFIYNNKTSFTRIDLNILLKKYDVTSLYFGSILDLIRLKYYLPTLRRSDVFVCWFSSWHTIIPMLFSKIFGKRFILIAGGYDSANIPEANYGNQRIWWKRRMSNYNFINSDIIVVNSHYIKLEISRINGVNADKIHVVYHGIPRSFETIQSKEKIALNVGICSKQNLLRKGILPFVEASDSMPDWKFVHAGKWIDDSILSVKYKKLPNASFEGYVSNEKLTELYRSASVYIQPSLHEGFGLSVIEAMQFGCIPIVSGNGALPEVVREYGVVLEKIDPEVIAAAIPEALNRFENKRNEIQEYINNNYDIDKRAEKIWEIVNSVI